MTCGLFLVLAHLVAVALTLFAHFRSAGRCDLAIARHVDELNRTDQWKAW
ncbi:hypothetical protein ACFW96_35690 [Streptomyces gardneri]